MQPNKKHKQNNGTHNNQDTNSQMVPPTTPGKLLNIEMGLLNMESMAKANKDILGNVVCATNLFADKKTQDFPQNLG